MFSLQDAQLEKLLDRFQYWGPEMLFRRYIFDYYLYFIDDSKLKMFIVLNIDDILDVLVRKFKKMFKDSKISFNFSSMALKNQINSIKSQAVAKSKLASISKPGVPATGAAPSAADRLAERTSVRRAEEFRPESVETRAPGTRRGFRLQIRCPRYMAKLVFNFDKKSAVKKFQEQSRKFELRLQGFEFGTDSRHGPSPACSTRFFESSGGEAIPYEYLFIPPAGDNILDPEFRGRSDIRAPLSTV